MKYNECYGFCSICGSCFIKNFTNTLILVVLLNKFQPREQQQEKKTKVEIKFQCFKRCMWMEVRGTETQ